jgi:hypothetical protein
VSDIKVDYPVQVVADASAAAVQLRPDGPDTAAADFLNAISLLLSYLEDHGRHGFLVWDPVLMEFACSCRRWRYRLGDPVEAVAAVAS